MIKTTTTLDENALEEIVYKIAFVVQAGWERYEHEYNYHRSWADYESPVTKTEPMWRHPIYGDYHTLDDAYWTSIDAGKFNRLQTLDKAWDEYICQKAKSGKKNAL